LYSPGLFDHKKLVVGYGLPETYITKITYIINSRKRGFSIRQISRDLKISQTTVKRVWKYYLDTGEKLIIEIETGR